jgi:hypothetical protein
MFPAGTRKHLALGVDSSVMTTATPNERSGITVYRLHCQRQLIASMQPELRRLYMRALRLNDSKAASELLRRAVEVLEYLNPILLKKPKLLANDLQRLLAVPVLISFRPQDGYYHQTLIKHLKELHVGSKTGIACDERARWKWSGVVGSLATLIWEVAEALRSKSIHPIRGDLSSIVLLIETKDPHIKHAAQSLHAFSHRTVDAWIDEVCLPILYLLRSDLIPSKQGRRKRSDPKRTNSSAKKLRDKIYLEARGSRECHLSPGRAAISRSRRPEGRGSPLTEASSCSLVCVSRNDKAQRGRGCPPTTAFLCSPRALPTVGRR